MFQEMTEGGIATAAKEAADIFLTPIMVDAQRPLSATDSASPALLTGHPLEVF
jgi:hypothetical protein